MSNSKPVILEWAKNGPRNSDGTFGWFLGMWLWWRTWAFLALMGLPLIAGVYALAYIGPTAGLLVTWALGGLLSEKRLSASHKYEVTKNY